MAHDVAAHFHIKHIDEVTVTSEWGVTLRGIPIIYQDPGSQMWISAAISSSGSRCHFAVFVHSPGKGIKIGPDKTCRYAKMDCLPGASGSSQIQCEFDDDLDKLRDNMQMWAGGGGGTILDGRPVVINPTRTPISSVYTAFQEILTGGGGEMKRFQTRSRRECGLERGSPPAGDRAGMAAQAAMAGVYLDGDHPSPAMARQQYEHMQDYNFVNCKRFAHVMQNLFQCPFPAEMHALIVENFSNDPQARNDVIPERDIYLCIELLGYTGLAWHWGVHVEDGADLGAAVTFEVKGECDLKGCNQAVMGPHGVVAHESLRGAPPPAGRSRTISEYGPRSGTQGGYIRMEKTTRKSNEEMVVHIREWVRRNPAYNVLHANCQHFVESFYNFLTGQAEDADFPYKLSTSDPTDKRPHPYNEASIHWNSQ